MKKFLIGAAIFLVFMGIGGIYRLFWFRSHQIGIFERKFAYKELAESKLGGKTPQETWSLYLDALEKGDVDLAVQYWVPEKREGVKKTMEKYKKAGVLQRYVKNHGRDLYKEAKPVFSIAENERAFSYDYLEEKDIDFIGAKGEYKAILEEFWKNATSNTDKARPEIIFQLNSYTRKWLIR